MTERDASGPGETFGAGLGFTEGPVWLGDGLVLFTSLNGTIYSLRDGEVEASVATGCGPTGLTVSASGEVYVAACSGLWGAPAEAPAGILRIDEGEARPVLTDGVAAPNDLAFGPDGRLYFTDPLSEAGLSEPIPGRVFAYDLEAERLDLLHEDGLFPNGLAFDRSGESLYVAESFAQRIVRYPWSREGLGEPEVLCETRDGTPDGMALDIEGNVWQAVNASDSVQVFDPDGAPIDRLPTGEGSYPSNCCFGGEGGTTLFVTVAGAERLAAFEVGVAGLPLYPFRER